jgi:tetratricopeptide (TPR) repeat protein
VALPGQRWVVQLLGGLRARHGDFEVKEFGGRHANLLLARLLLEAGKPLSRDSLADQLWPDLYGRNGQGQDDRPKRRSNLRRALNRVNAALAVAGSAHVKPILAKRDTLCINPEAIECDANEFERYAHEGNTTRAQALYRGPLLPGFDEEWVEEQRARLATLHEDLASAAGSPTAPNGSHPAHHLPPPADGLLGRETEARRLLAALGRHRLVVVAGPAGCGKTMLCNRVARTLPDLDFCVSVGLQDCRTLAGLPDYIRAALGLPQDDMAPRRPVSVELLASPLWFQVIAHLKGRRALMLLDNFEHLTGEPATAVLEALLQHLPDLQLLLTTQRAVHTPSARILKLKPLPVPEVGASLASASRNPGVALFVAKARTVNAGFSLNQRNLSGVVEIVRTLDGLPLSLEIAASRLRARAREHAGKAKAPTGDLTTPHALSVALRRSKQAVERANDQPARSGRSGRPGALDAALALSWQPLDAGQRGALVALTVFRGGWTAAQAQAVCGVQDLRALLHVLIQAALVSPDAAGPGGPRYHLLDSMQDFAAVQLPTAVTAARRRHRKHFAGLAGLWSLGKTQFNPADLPNMLMSVAAAMDDHAHEEAAATCLALEPYWIASGATAEAIATLRRLVAALPEASTQWPAVSSLMTSVLVAAGHAKEAHSLAERALAAAGDDDARQAQALLSVAGVRWLAARDGPAALVSAQAAFKLASRRGWPQLQARALNLMGAAGLSVPGHVSKSKSHFQRAHVIFEQAGDTRGELRALSGRSACLMQEGRFRSAIKLAKHGEQLADKLQDTNAQLQFYSRISSCWEALEQPARALQVCRRHTRLAWTRGLTYHLAYGLWNQCEPRARLGQLAQAIQLMAFTMQHWVARFDALDASDQAHIDAVMRLVSDGLGEERSAALWQQGLSMSEGEAIAIALG